MTSSPDSSVRAKTLIWDEAGAAADVDADIDTSEPQRRQSLYVEIFDRIQGTVLQHEAFLFSERELACLARLQTLSYPARYLLIRLCLCKRGKWHTLASLEARYTSEIGARDRIAGVIDELCGGGGGGAVDAVTQWDGPDVIDLTRDEEGEGGGELSAGVSAGGDALDPDLGPGSGAEDLSVFAADDTSASVPDLLACLSADELKSLARQMKVAARPPAQTRAALIDAILSHASSQATLNFHILAPRNNSTRTASKSGAGPPPRRAQQLALNYGKDGRRKTQYASVRRLIAKMIGRCVRVEPAVFALFDRLNLVFFRSTTHGSSLLLPALLAAFRKRQYGSGGVDVEYSRTAHIFPSREALLDYEQALMLESRIDEVFGGDDGGASPVFAPGNAKHGQATGRVRAEEPLSADSVRVQNARVVRDIWEKVYDRWGDLIACKDEGGKGVRGLERFECGHVLTRIVYKGCQALAILKEYELEMKVLRALLSQTKWRRGRRGAWYDRLALVLMTHCERTQENLDAAMDVVICGLQDEYTHLTYRPRLERRLTRLENLLKIPKDQRHTCRGELQKANEVFVEGVRIYKHHQAASAAPNKSDRLKCTAAAASPSMDRSNSETPPAVAGTSKLALERQASLARLSDFDTAARTDASLNPKQPEPRQTGKTFWVGRHGDEVSVEQLALEYYEDMGFKGFHSEGSIVSTIFGLLFWDVIFAPVPGAFETPFQSAPLDIHEDGFYSARTELIERRLKELKEGRAHELIQQVDERERPSKTWCIGVDWKFERQDLLEIVDCLGGHALGVICRMICEDYTQWRGGVPDLFVWNARDGACKFVEVKSPKDTLQENQKVWIDVLLGSETPVDLCHVAERGVEKKPRKSRLGKKRKAVVQPKDEEVESEDEDIDMLDSPQEEPQGSKRPRSSEEFIVSHGKLTVEVVLPKRRKS